MHRRDILRLGLSSLLGSLYASTYLRSPAQAQADYPQHSIRLIVPRSAGGVLDVVGRHWAEWATSKFGVGVVVENQGGGGGITGTTAAAHASSDGYTLLLGSTSDLVLNPVLSTASLYDPIKDFAPVAIIAISVAAIIVHPSVPAKNLKELAAYAKANPGKLSYGSAGAGTMANLCGELFKTLAGTPDIVHIPYKGAAAGYADLLAGNIPMMAVNITGTMLAMHREGRVRILAIATDHHLKAAPDIPTAAEAGYPDLIAQLFVGVFAPAKTPEPIVQRLAQLTSEALAATEFQDKLEAAGFEPLPGFGPDKTATYIRQEIVRWTPILKESGMKAEQ
jgi:tripartite-type tricarboxylate transporter receptor subunit TctC